MGAGASIYLGEESKEEVAVAPLTEPVMSAVRSLPAAHGVTWVAAVAAAVATEEVFLRGMTAVARTKESGEGSLQGWAAAILRSQAPRPVTEQVVAMAKEAASATSIRHLLLTTGLAMEEPGRSPRLSWKFGVRMR